MVQTVVRVRFQRLCAEAVPPHYGRLGDAGMDLYSCECHTLQPGERHLFGTGLAIAIPGGYVGLVWDRSGLAASSGLTTLGGVIDSNYRGELRVVVLNTGSEPYFVEAGHRIAQLLVQPVASIALDEVSELDSTERGVEGFGSSGR